MTALSTVFSVIPAAEGVKGALAAYKRPDLHWSRRDRWGHGCIGGTVAAATAAAVVAGTVGGALGTLLDRFIERKHCSE